jgi:4-aminobutyrate aminotransferase
VEFRDENGAPDKASAKAVSGACLERGLMLLTCGPWDNTIRWIPPLIVSEAQIARGLSIFADALENVLGKSS